MASSRYSRRDFLTTSALAAGALAAARYLPRRARAAEPAMARFPAREIAPGPFQPTWDSLVSGYAAPEWFRDAKFGIWAHWSAQCVPEMGDWYARRMYLQGDPIHDFHTRTYGHPSKVGFMEIEHLWKAERWEPEQLVALYQKAGAKYFFALANHHDNFDTYASKHHAWNAVNVGPKRDLIGGWAKAVRAAGMRFGVSNHSAHAWHWYQPAYGYDPEGPLAGIRYDAFTLRKEDGQGKWWEGLDPQELYTGPSLVMPDGLTSIKAADEWHEQNDRVWTEVPPARNPAFVERWFLRCKDLIDSYQPDIIYFDDTELPLGQAGLEIAAHYYNASLGWHGGKLDVVVNAKLMSPAHKPAVVEDIERGVATDVLTSPWQTDTCIGSWHYERKLFEEHRYKTVPQVVHMLLDIVSKNGNLMLSVPIRGDGSIDADEVAFLEGMAEWMKPNGEGIFGSRPWRRFGEGPATLEKIEAGHFGGARDVRSGGYTAQDLRFTRKGNTLYAYFLGWPPHGSVTIRSLNRAVINGQVQRVSLLGAGEVRWNAGDDGLVVSLPDKAPGQHAFGLKIEGLLL